MPTCSSAATRVTSLCPAFTEAEVPAETEAASGPGLSGPRDRLQPVATEATSAPVPARSMARCARAGVLFFRMTSTSCWLRTADCEDGQGAAGGDGRLRSEHHLPASWRRAARAADRRVGREG